MSSSSSANASATAEHRLPRRGRRVEVEVGDEQRAARVTQPLREAEPVDHATGEARQVRDGEPVGFACLEPLEHAVEPWPVERAAGLVEVIDNVDQLVALAV